MTDEQWDRLRPFAEARDAAIRQAADIVNAHIDPADLRKVVERNVAIEAAQSAVQDANAAFNVKQREVLGAS